jgi:hypothetical protein
VQAGNGAGSYRSILRAGNNIVTVTDYPPTYQDTTSPWMGRAAVSIVNAADPSNVTFACVDPTLFLNRDVVVKITSTHAPLH